MANIVKHSRGTIFKKESPKLAKSSMKISSSKQNINHPSPQKTYSPQKKMSNNNYDITKKIENIKTNKSNIIDPKTYISTLKNEINNLQDDNPENRKYALNIYARIYEIIKEFELKLDNDTINNLNNIYNTLKNPTTGIVWNNVLIITNNILDNMAELQNKKEQLERKQTKESLRMKQKEEEFEKITRENNERLIRESPKEKKSTTKKTKPIKKSFTEQYAYNVVNKNSQKLLKSSSEEQAKQLAMITQTSPKSLSEKQAMQLALSVHNPIKKSQLSSEDIAKRLALTVQKPKKSSSEDIAKQLALTVQKPKKSSSEDVAKQLALSVHPISKSSSENAAKQLSFSLNPQTLEEQLLSKSAEEQALSEIKQNKQLMLPPSKIMALSPPQLSLSLNNINKLTQEIINEFSTVTGGINNEIISIQTIIDKILLLNNLLDQYDSKNYYIETKLLKGFEMVNTTSITSTIKSYFNILEFSVKEINKLIRFKLSAPKRIIYLENKLSTLKSNHNIKYFQIHVSTIETIINNIKLELDDPTFFYKALTYKKVKDSFINVNKYYGELKKIMDNPSKKNPESANNELTEIIKKLNLYPPINEYNIDTLKESYDDIIQLTTINLKELEKSKNEINIFLKTPNLDPTQAKIYYYKLFQTKQMLAKLMETLQHKKYIDYNVDFSPDISYLAEDSNSNQLMNKIIDPLIISINQSASQSDVTKIKEYIDNIENNSPGKWVNFSIIYQKIYNITRNKIRIFLKHYLLIKILGLYDYRKDWIKPSDIFYETADKTMDEIGEPPIDEIIINVFINKDIQEALESLRSTDIEISKMFKEYKDVKGMEELFKNLLVMQFNNFVIKIRPYCGGAGWNIFMDRFVGVFNKKLEGL